MYVPYDSDLGRTHTCHNGVLLLLSDILIIIWQRVPYFNFAPGPVDYVAFSDDGTVVYTFVCSEMNYSK